MLVAKEKRQEAENVFTIYRGLPEKEKIMLLAYSTALRDRALFSKSDRSETVPDLQTRNQQ